MPEHPHLDALHRALAAAGAHERDALEALHQLPLPERIEAGVSWPRLEIEEASHAGKGHTRLLLRAARGVMLHEGLSPGDRVEVALSDGAGLFEGRLEDAGDRWAEVRVDGDAPPHGGADLTRLFDPTPWRRLADALARADGHRSRLRDVLLGERPPSPPSSHRPDAPPGLDPSQAEAARVALDAGELALIHGPPGTGKTHLLVALLGALVDRGERPWALADSNAAVDHLAGRAADAGLDAVRLGSWGRMSPRGRALSLRTRIAEGPYGTALEALDRDLSRLVGRTDPDSRDARKRLYGERRRLRDQARAQALQSAQVLLTTLGTLARLAPDLPAPRTALVDEATQALEPAIWTAVPFVERLVLVGDPHQLGPVVKLPDSPLEASLLQRLLDALDPDEPGALPLPMLQTQYRMHAHIQALVADVYGPTYHPHPDVADHRLCDLPGVSDTPLTARPTLWIDTSGAGLDEELDAVTRSWSNPGEVRLVAAVVQRLRQAGVATEAIGVIAPYSAQVQLLREQPELDGVEVATVNAFQGREKEAIVCSWTRSNPHGRLGFVEDGRRLTVALTRARRLHVSVGDTATLGTHPRFSAVLEALAAQESWESVWSPPWSDIP
jgi:ATP-dependent RNA/DNA helicase IGHMBP2